MSASINKHPSFQITYQEDQPSSAEPYLVGLLNNAIELRFKEGFRFKIQLHTESRHKDNKQRLEVIFEAHNKRFAVNCPTSKTIWDFEQALQTFISQHSSKSSCIFWKRHVIEEGCVESLVASLNYGTIKTSSDEIVYFHSDSLIKEPFEQLNLGCELKFNLINTPLGLQAINIEKVQAN